MKILTDSFVVTTHGKGTYEITTEVESIVSKSDIKEGVVTVFVRHTSCSLIVMENADSSARTDLHAFFDELVPEVLLILFILMREEMICPLILECVSPM